MRAAVDVLESEGVAACTARRVAASAATSTAALYELFGDKAGLLRAVYFGGFALLEARMAGLAETADPRRDLSAVLAELRHFVRDRPALAELMFGRPFGDFDPGPEDAAAARPLRELIVRRVRRCVEAGVLAGNEADIAEVLLAMVEGLARRERAGRLGSSRAAVNRRWDLACQAVLAGLTGTPGAPAPVGRRRPVARGR